MADLLLDASRSRVRIQTFAEGLLARLAHDLELVCGDLSGTASSSAEGATGTASVTLPLRGIAVAGVLGKDGHVDPRGLSPSEQHDCLAKMQHDVFHAGPEGVVRVEVDYDAGSARLRIVPPNGKAVEAVIRPEVHAVENGINAKGTFDLSLKAIGSDVVKGPMGAFRTKDRVTIVFDVVFTQRTPA